MQKNWGVQGWCKLTEAVVLSFWFLEVFKNMLGATGVLQETAQSHEILKSMAVGLALEPYPPPGDAG